MRGLWTQGSTAHNILGVLTCLGVFLICSNALVLWRTPLRPVHRARLYGYEPAARRTHPIDTLMRAAETDFQALLSRQTSDIDSAATTYREHRGRHPPPGFDAWFEYARRNDAVIVEDQFDQIYHDLTPFWGVPAKDIREFAKHFEHRIYVRNGTANTMTSHNKGTQKERMEAWLSLTQSIEQLLPDPDMAINIMDESRVIVPWENISK